MPCKLGCFSCTNALECLSCDAAGNYFKFADDDTNKKCEKAITLVEGYFFNSASKEFQKCDDSCNTCAISAGECLSCKAGLYQKLPGDDKKCYALIVRFYIASGFLKPCKLGCLTCANDIECLSCDNENNYFPSAASAAICVTTDAGKYFDSTSNSVQNCDRTCRLCAVTAENCLACATNFYPLENNTKKCVEKTNANFIYSVGLNKYFYLRNDSIQKFVLCDASCKTCINNKITCGECAENFFKKFGETNNICYNKQDYSEGFYIFTLQIGHEIKNLIRDCDAS